MVFYLSRVFQIMEGLPWGTIVAVCFAVNIIFWFVSWVASMLKPYFHDASEDNYSKNSEFNESEVLYHD